MESNLDRLARYVKTRRGELDMSQREVWAAGGPSMPTQTRIENGERPEPNKGTLAKIDKALKWAPGSARLVMLGGEPIPSRLEGLGRGLAKLIPTNPGEPQDDLTKTLARLHMARADLEVAIDLLEGVRRNAKAQQESQQGARGAESGRTSGQSGAPIVAPNGAQHAGISGTGPDVALVQDDLDLAAYRGGPKLSQDQRNQQDEEALRGDPEGPDEGA